MASTSVNRSVNIFIESGEAEKAQQRLSNKAKQLQDDLKKATDPVVIKRLTSELKTTEGQLERVSKKVKGEVQPSFRDLQNTVNALGRRLKTMSENDADFTKVLVQYQRAKVELGEMKTRVDSLNNGFQQSTKSSSGFFNGLAGFAKGVGALALAQISVQGITNLISGSIEEFQAAELATARFEARLNNLGQSSAIPRLTKFAEELADQFKFLDNDDILNVFEQFINYGKLTEQQIKQLTPVVVDFAAQQQISVQEAAGVIIKALEGNGKALKEYGIDIKDAKNETEAFGIVMDQLKPKVEGAAETFSQTLAGSAAITKQEIANLKEELGENFQPVVKKFYETLAGVSTIFRKTISADVGFFTKVLALTGNIKAQAEVAAANAIADFKKEQEALLNDGNFLQLLTSPQTALLNQGSNVLGTGGGDGKDKPQGKSKAQLQREKELEDQKKLQEEIKKLGDDLLFYNASQITKEIRAVDIKYDQLRERAKGNAALLKEIDELNVRERNIVFKNYFEKLQAEADKNAEELRKKSEAEAQKLKELFEKRQLASLEYTRKQLEQNAREGLNQLEGSLEVEIMESMGLKKLEAQRKLLKIQEEEEVAAAEKTGESVEAIRAKYREKGIQLLTDQIDQIISFTQTALSAVTQIFDAVEQRENQRLDDNRRRYDRQREGYKNLLDNQKLSREQYDKQVAALDKKQEAEEKALRLKQFKREQALALVNIAIQTAQAVVKAIAASPLTGGLPFSAIAAAVGAVQAGIVLSQKPPQYAKGGMLKGPRHVNGGMPVINPITGTVEAEVEGGEAILSRNFVRNNPNLVAAALESSQNGGYNIEAPFSRTAIKPMNVGLVTSSMGNVRRYESGGILPATSNTAQQQQMDQMSQLLAKLNDRLSHPFVGYVTLDSFDDANDRRNQIIEDATMR